MLEGIELCIRGDSIIAGAYSKNDPETSRPRPNIPPPTMGVKISRIDSEGLSKNSTQRRSERDGLFECDNYCKGMASEPHPTVKSSYTLSI